MVPRDVSYSDFDLESALEVTGGDRKLLKELADIFLQQYPEFLFELRQAVLQRDSNAIEANAHKLRGSVTHFGARVAAQSAARLEAMGSSSDFTDVDEALRDFELSLDSFLAELRTFHS